MEIDQFTRAKIKVMNRVQKTVEQLSGVDAAMKDALYNTIRNEDRESIKKSMKEIQAIQRFKSSVFASKNYLDIHNASVNLSKQITEFAPFVESMNEDLFEIISGE